MYSNIFDNLVEIPLEFSSEKYTNIFKDKNNKTLKETLEDKRYIVLKDEVYKKYNQFLNIELGTFLFNLKNDGDLFYKKFLNEYGDLEYNNFKITNKNYLDIKGVYFYFLDDKLKYIGRCRDNMKKRVNSGYGQISPKKCYKDGQSTNCKVNSLISKDISSIKLKIFIMDNNEEIEILESKLIKKFSPNWNCNK